jgi:hypothetical protein
MQKSMVYFDKPGPKNTNTVITAVTARVKELGLKYAVVASNSGETALKFREGLKGLDVSIVAVTGHAGFSGGDKMGLEPAQRQALENNGIQVVTASHVLSGVGRSITKKFGGVTPVEIIAHVLRQFGTEGLKVAVEVAVMAADAGLVPTDREIIAVGGTGAGADTAIVLKAAHMNNFFDLEIREIVAKPRQRK